MYVHACQLSTGIMDDKIRLLLLLPLLLLLLHPFNGLFSRTILVSRYQKGKTSLDLNEARDDVALGWQWHQLDHMQIICTSLQTACFTFLVLAHPGSPGKRAVKRVCVLLQTDNHTNTPSLNFYRLHALPDAQPTVSKHWRHQNSPTSWRHIHQLATSPVCKMPVSLKVSRGSRVMVMDSFRLYVVT